MDGLSPVNLYFSPSNTIGTLRWGCGSRPFRANPDKQEIHLIMDETTRYRRALGTYATGVAVVTIAAEPNDSDVVALGMTINSFVSVSLEPRLILWCVDDASERGKLFALADVFAINVISDAQQGLADRCARRQSYRLTGSDAKAGPNAGSAPVVHDALARLSCRVHERHQMGDHLVIVGEVVDFEAREGEGLTYFRGQYGRIEAS
jgi:flavin reductase (DIM6/NTAB) family NADH-FMN oxidoreductase RutF